MFGILCHKMDRDYFYKTHHVNKFKKNTAITIIKCLMLVTRQSLTKEPEKRYYPEVLKC